MFKILPILIITGASYGLGFSFSEYQVDTVDQHIIAGIQEVYKDMYFNDPDGLSAYFESLKELSESHERWHMMLYLLTSEAQCMAFHHRYDEMYFLVRNAEQIIHDHHQVLSVLDTNFDARNGITFTKGMYFYYINDFHITVKVFDEMLRKGKFLTDDFLFSIHSYLGASYSKMLLYDKAYVHYSKAMKLASGTQDSVYYRALNYAYLGSCKTGMVKYGAGDDQDLQMAVKFYNQALDIFLKGKNDHKYRNALPSTFQALASIHTLQGDYDSAAHYLTQSLEYHNENDSELIATYLHFGDIYKKNGNYKVAEEYYRKSFKRADKLYSGDHETKTYPLYMLAELFISRQKYDSALYLAEKGLSYVVNKDEEEHVTGSEVKSDTIINHLEVLGGLKLKGQALAGIYRQNRSDKDPLHSSINSFLASLSVISEIDKKIPFADYKKYFKAHLQPMYEQALEVVYTAVADGINEQEYTDLMYVLFESNKNSMLKEAMNNTMALKYAGVPSNIIERESILKAKAANIRRTIAEGGANNEIAILEDDLYRVTSRLDSLIENLEVKYPRYHQLKYKNHIASLEEIQQVLDDEEIVLEYFWGDNTVYVMAISNKVVAIEKIPLSKELTKSVEGLILSSRSKSSDLSSFIAHSSDVYNQFLAPILSNFSESEFESLIIVTDGKLSYLPFELLLTESVKSSADFTNLPYLVRDYKIRNVFSSSLLTEEWQVNAQRHEYEYLAFAPVYEGAVSSSRISGNASSAFLKYNQEEVLNISEYFDSKIFTSDEATEENFVGHAASGKIVHLAAHAFTSDIDPSFSGLLFSSSDSALNSQDGLLHLDEIYNLSLNADLVVLSGCETGTGKFSRGEGVISLGRAFRYAGCSNIVMSHWQVNDRSTAIIMEDFFKNLKRGMSKDDALRQAKLSFIDDPENKYFSHPYYWSAFTLSGDSAPVVAGIWYENPLFLILIVVAILLIVILAIRKYTS